MGIIVWNNEEVITGAEIKQRGGVVRGAIEIDVEVTNDDCNRERRMKSVKVSLKRGYMPELRGTINYGEQKGSIFSHRDIQ